MEVRGGTTPEVRITDEFGGRIAGGCLQRGADSGEGGALVGASVDEQDQTSRRRTDGDPREHRGRHPGWRR